MSRLKWSCEIGDTASKIMMRKSTGKGGTDEAKSKAGLWGVSINAVMDCVFRDLFFKCCASPTRL